MTPFRALAAIVLVGLNCCALHAADNPTATPPLGIKLPVKAEFPGEGFSSLGVYNDKGELIRTLSYALPVKKGDVSFRWDGTTDLGVPAQPGKYSVHGVWFPEQPKLDYVMKVGVSGNPPYITESPTSAWGGNLGGPSGIATNGKQILAIFACVESPHLTGIQVMDLNGNIQRFFTSFYPWDIRLACAMDDKNFYVAIGVLNDKRLIIGKYDITGKEQNQILCDVPTGDHKDGGGVFGTRWTVDVRGAMAVANGKLYVPVFLDDKLQIMSTTDGKLVKSADVPSPRGVSMNADGKGYILSGKKLMHIDADGNLGAVVVDGLDNPAGLAQDAAGNLYVTEQGTTQQVKVFSQDGKLIRNIGKDGGMPPIGKYDPTGMNQPNSICVTPDGNAWITTSDTFQEVSVWNPQGQRAKTYYDSEMLSGQGRLSPDRDEMIVGYPDDTERAGVRTYKIDLKNKTWEPSWSQPMPLDRMHQDDVFVGNDHVYGGSAAMFDGHEPYLSWSDGSVKGPNGKTYLFGGDLSLWLFDEKTKEPKLTAFLYTHNTDRLPDGRYQGNYDRGAMQNMFAWADKNGDGKMSLDEVTFSENVAALKDANTNGMNRMQSWQINPDLSIYFLAGNTVYLLKPTEILANGAPVYDWSKLEKVVDLKVPDFKGGEEGNYKEIQVTLLNFLSVVDGHVYVLATPSPKNSLKMTGIDGDGWWGSRNWRMSPMRFDLKTGEPSWIKLGRRAPGQAKPGEMYYPGWGLAGAMDGVNYWTDTLSQVWAWTDDGLYLGPLYGGDGKFDANSLSIELVGAYLYKIDGETYLLGGDHGVSVHKVIAPKLTQIKAGELTLSAEQAAQAKPWDPDGPAPGKRPIATARSICTFDLDKNPHTRQITIDGKLDPAEWDGIAPLDIKLDGKKVATVKVTFDDQNLYLAYDVRDPNGLKNDGHELPYAPYVSGSYVDFVLGSQWSDPDRTAPVEGDVRVILAKITGQNSSDYQMGFWPIKKEPNRYEGAPPSKPQTIQSPAQTRVFDDISPIQGLTYAYQTTPTGYTLEVSAPLKQLGIRPANTPSIGFDASVGFGDAAGQIRTRAAHWSGQSESTVVDRPGSTELKPGTWGTLQLDRNPIPAVSK